MKRVFVLGTILLCFGLSSCQCSNKPDIGPVEDDQQQAQRSPAPSDAPVMRYA
jgi:hypothetical protein